MKKVMSDKLQLLLRNPDAAKKLRVILESARVDSPATEVIEFTVNNQRHSYRPQLVTIR